MSNKQHDTDRPSRLFISYRRDDGAWADRLYEHLVPAFGKENVFLDVDGSIAAGFSWEEWIDRQVAQCDIMLVLVGPRWKEEFERHANPGDRDHVRLEIERALAHDIPVVPVRLGDAALPVREALPTSIRPLLAMQERRLGRHDRFQPDLEELIRAVRSSTALSRTQKAQHQANRPANSLALQRLQRDLLASGMPTVDVGLTISVLSSCSSYLERGSAAGVHGLGPAYDQAPDFATGVDVEKAISALNHWFAEVNVSGESGQFGYVNPLSSLSSNWMYVDWKGDEIPDRRSAKPIRILRPAIFADSGGLVCVRPGKVLAVISDLITGVVRN